MKRLFIDDLYSSFTLWFDHQLLDKGEAYSNASGSLAKRNDPNLSSYHIYASQYKQWVYDKSITGANIPSGVYVDNSFVSRGVSGLKIDYQEGRAIFTGSKSNWSVSGNFAVKDFNIYTTTKSDEELLFETNYVVNPSTKYMATGDLTDKVVAPCIFLKIKNMDNEDFAFGGMDNTVVNARAMILASSESSLQGVGNIFCDSQKTSFCLLNNTPLNRFGDTKSGMYNYTGLVQESFDYSNLVYIQKAKFSKLNQQAISNKFPDLYVGFIDLRLELPRWPRA